MPLNPQFSLSHALCHLPIEHCCTYTDPKLPRLIRDTISERAAHLHRRLLPTPPSSTLQSALEAACLAPDGNGEVVPTRPWRLCHSYPSGAPRLLSTWGPRPSVPPTRGHPHLAPSQASRAHSRRQQEGDSVTAVPVVSSGEGNHPSDEFRQVIRQKSRHRTARPTTASLANIVRAVSLPPRPPLTNASPPSLHQDPPCCHSRNTMASGRAPAKPTR